MKKLFNNDDTWYAFVYGTIVGMLAGMTILYVIASLSI
jgi:hypothetical protein